MTKKRLENTERRTGGELDMWIVYDSVDGLVGIFDNYEEAIREYAGCVNTQKDLVSDEGWFTLDENVILAKVVRHLYGYETNEKAVTYDENGEEIETEDNLWDWKEDVYQGFKQAERVRE